MASHPYEFSTSAGASGARSRDRCAAAHDKACAEARGLREEMQRRQWIAPIEIERDVRAHDLAQPLRQRKFADRVQLAECEKVRNRIQHDEVQLIRARDLVMFSRKLADAVRRARSIPLSVSRALPPVKRALTSMSFHWPSRGSCLNSTLPSSRSPTCSKEAEAFLSATSGFQSGDVIGLRPPSFSVVPPQEAVW